MPDIDSPSARSRQNPTSLRRTTRPKKRAVSRRKSTGNLPERRSTSYFNRIGNAAKPKRSRSRRSSDDGSSNSRRRATIRRRTKTRQPVERKKPPVVKPPVTDKTDTRPKPPVAKKKPLTPEQQRAQIEAYLRGDSTYQGQLANFNKSLADFQSEQGLARTDYDTNYQNTYRDIGLARDDALGDLENDFAARGLLHSSMYNTETGDLRNQYQNQYTDLGEQKTSYMDQLVQDLSRFKNEQTVAQQNARAEAIRRRAEKQGI